MAGVVDHLPQYRAALDAVLDTVREMVAVEGPGGWLHPHSLQEAATRHGLTNVDQWERLLAYLIAEGHLWPQGRRWVATLGVRESWSGPCCYAYRVRSIERRPFDAGAPYPLPWRSVKVVQKGEREHRYICVFHRGKRALKGHKRRVAA